jgi:4-hydroxyphenylpyruvate dioxygenase
MTQLIKRLSCTTATFGGTLEQRLSAMKAAGFAATEFWPRDLFESFTDADTALRILRESGLAISCFQGLRDFESMPPAVRDHKLQLADHLIDQLKLVGADLLVLCCNTSADCSRDWTRAVEDLRLLGDLGRSRNVRIGYEPLCYSPWIGDYRMAWDLIRQVDHSHVGLVLDSAHVFLLNLPLEPISDIPGDKIFLAEYADLPTTNLSIREVVRYYRLFPGEGTQAMAEFACRVEGTGYAGYHSVEIFSSRYEAMEPALVARRAFEAMTNLFTQIAPPGAT